MRRISTLFILLVLVGCDRTRLLSPVPTVEEADFLRMFYGAGEEIILVVDTAVDEAARVCWAAHRLQGPGTLTGTVRESRLAAGGFDYSNQPTDRLVLQRGGHVPRDFVVTGVQGNFAGDWEDLRNEHDVLDFETPVVGGRLVIHSRATAPPIGAGVSSQGFRQVVGEMAGSDGPMHIEATHRTTRTGGFDPTRNVAAHSLFGSLVHADWNITLYDLRSFTEQTTLTAGAVECRNSGNFGPDRFESPAARWGWIQPVMVGSATRAHASGNVLRNGNVYGTLHARDASGSGHDHFRPILVRADGVVIQL